VDQKGLRGSSGARIDDKGRLKVPTMFRGVIQDQQGPDVFVTSLTGECVRIYPMQVWLEVERKLSQMPASHPSRLKFLDRVNYYGQVGELDGQGRVVIPPQFSGEGGSVSDLAFSEGLAAVRVYKDKVYKWGYIDKSGKVVIEPQFAAAGPFSEGRAMVGIAEPSWTINYTWGFIDTEGRWIAKPQFGSAGEFSEGLAPVLMKDKVGFINLQGEIAIKPQFAPDGGGGCVRNGRVGASRFSEGLAAVQLKTGVWGREWGFIDRFGNWVIQPAFSCAAPFSEGLALIGVREDEGPWRYGYIDKTGAIVIKPQFSEASSFDGKLALVTIGMTDEQALVKAMESGKPEAEIEKELEKFKQKYAYIDRTGKIVWQTPD